MNKVEMGLFALQNESNLTMVVHPPVSVPGWKPENLHTLCTKGMSADLDGDILNGANMTCMYFQPQTYISVGLIWNTRFVKRKLEYLDIPVTRHLELILRLQYVWEQSGKSKTQFKKRSLRQLKKQCGITNKSRINGFEESNYCTKQYTGHRMKTLGMYVPNLNSWAGAGNHQ